MSHTRCLRCVPVLVLFVAFACGPRVNAQTKEDDAFISQMLDVANLFQRTGTMSLEAEDSDGGLGPFKMAGGSYEKALERAEKTYGPNHLVTSDILSQMGEMFVLAGATKQGEGYVQRAIRIRQANKLDSDHLALSANWSDLGKCRLTVRDLAKAEEYFLEAIRIREKAKKDFLLSESLLDLAAVYRGQGLPAKALPLNQRAVKLREADREDIKLADALVALGEQYLKTGDYKEAEPVFARALQIAEKEKGKDSTKAALALFDQGWLQWQLGKYDAAEKLAAEALKIRQQRLGDKHYRVAQSLGLLGDIQVRLNKHPEAVVNYEKSIAINEAVKGGAESTDIATTLNGLAMAKEDLGDYAAADALYQRSLKIAQTVYGPDHPDVAQVIANRGHLYAMKGDQTEAEALYRRAGDIMFRKLGPEHPKTAEVYNNLGGVYQKMGQYQKAQEHYELANRILTKVLGPDHPRVAVTVNNLGYLAAQGNNPAEAQRLFQQSLTTREKALGPEHVEVADALNNLGAYYNDESQFAEAEKNFRRALAIYDKRIGAGHPRSALILNNLALSCLGLDRDAEAEKLLLQAYKITEKIGGQDHVLITQNLAAVQARLGKWKVAETSMDQSARVLRRHVKTVLPVLSEEEQLKFIARQFLTAYESSLSFGYLRRQEASAANLSAGWLLNGKGMQAQAVGERTLLGRDASDPKLAPLVDRLTAVRKRASSLAFNPPEGADAEKVRAEIRQLNTTERSLVQEIGRKTGRGGRAEPWVELDEARAAIPKDAVFVDIAKFEVNNLVYKTGEKRWQPARYVAWITPAVDAGQPRVVDLGLAEPIDALVATARTQFENAAKEIQSAGEKDAEQLLQKTLGELAKLVLHPLEIEGTNRWILSPDASLWLIPWAALPLADGAYAVEKHSLSYVVCGRDLVAPAPKLAANPPLIFADPDYGLGAAAASAITRNIPAAPDKTLAQSSPASFDLPPVERLPATSIEARLIQSPLESYAKSTVQLYEGQNALEKIVKAIHSPKVLVLSTHGFFLPDQESAPGHKSQAPAIQNPLLRCGLLFAGCNERKNRPANTDPSLDDGIFTGLEIIATDLKGTELVVLSACETGLGKVRTGEGVAGLRQAFQIAGSQAVAASLWQVPDRETAKLMAGFFAGVSEGTPKAEALRRSQIKLIRARREKGDAAHPFYWAAFTLTGSADFLPVKEPEILLFTAEQFIERGQGHEKAGKLDLALADFAAAVKADSENAQAHFLFAFTSNQLGATDDAILGYSEVIRLRPDLPAAFLQRSDLLRTKGDYVRALDDAEKAIKLNPDAARGYAARGDTHRLMKDSEKALADFAKALEIEPEYPFVRSTRADLYDDLKEYGKAIEDLTALLKMQPKNTSALNRRGLAYAALKNYDQAIASYREAIQINPKYHFPYGNLGVLYDTKGDKEQAIKELTAGIEANPKYIFAWNRRGLIRQQLGRHEEAIADFTEVSKLNPKSVDALANRAVSKQRLKQLPGAIEDLSAAIQKDPKYAWAISRRGQLRAELGEFEKATADAQQAVELEPYDNFYRSQRALFFLQKKDLAGYRDFCQATVKALGDTTKPDVANSVAWICAVVPDAVTDYAKPVKLGELAGTAEPKQYTRIGTQGAILYRAGKFEDAIKTLESSAALEGKGGMTEDHLFLAMAHHKAGHADDARRELATATKWIDQKIADGDKATDYSWSRKLELTALRQEAETLLNAK